MYVMVRILLLEKYFLCNAWNAQTLVQDAEFELAYSFLDRIHQDTPNHAIVKIVIQTN